MIIELAFLKCKKTHQYPKYLMSNGFLNLNNKFCHLYKTHGYGFFKYNVLVLCV